MIESITPVILTYNEAPNIGRTIKQLHWAKDIVIVDSFSDDDTLDIASQFPNVRISQRKFDAHAKQWNYAIQETGIKSDWILALDADYILSDELIEELRSLKPQDSIVGYRASFKYCVYGKPLRGSVYPPVTVLFRHENAFYKQDGHTQRVIVDGNIGDLKSPIFHDDRKPLEQWLNSQNRYMELEAHKLLSTDINQLNWADRLRRIYFIAPFVMFLYCLFIKGAVLDGKAGFFYAFQRMLAELILSLHLIQKTLNNT